MYRKVFQRFTIVLLLLVSGALQAQSLDDFLACAEFSDRIERVICLEETLESATASNQEVDIQENESTVEDFGQTSEVAISEEVAEPEAERRFLPRIRMPSLGGIFSRDRDAEEDVSETESEVEATASSENVEDFGREQARVIENEDGRQELIDVVTDLGQYRPNMWEITLASGQVWMQTHSRRYNLREGDSVRIYPSRWGDSYRLETDRLNGYIQVGRAE